MALYHDPALRSVLPAILHASDNANGAARSSSVYVFPPLGVCSDRASWFRQV